LMVRRILVRAWGGRDAGLWAASARLP
jgi:hypothetical protein